MIEIPESVHAYLTNPGVRAATDMLLESDIDEPVPGLGWSEITDYQRALLAACQVRTEFVEALERLWIELWQTRLPAGWSQADPDEHIEKFQFEPSLETFWDDRIYARVLTRRKPARYLYVMVSLNPDGAKVGFGLWDDSDVPRISTLDGFDDDEGDLWSVPTEIGKDSRVLDTAVLVTFVSSALTAIETAN